MFEIMFTQSDTYVLLRFVSIVGVLILPKSKQKTHLFKLHPIFKTLNFHQFRECPNHNRQKHQFGHFIFEGNDPSVFKYSVVPKRSSTSPSPARKVQRHRCLTRSELREDDVFEFR